MIAPTVGRIVWFRPGPHRGIMTVHGDQPLAAQVVYVWNDRLVNLLVTDHHGTQHAVSSVPLKQEGDERPLGGYAEWMPYQTGQAAKHAAPPIVAAPATEPLPPPPPVIATTPPAPERPPAPPPAAKPRGKRK